MNDLQMLLCMAPVLIAGWFWVMKETRKDGE